MHVVSHHSALVAIGKPFLQGSKDVKGWVIMNGLCHDGNVSPVLQSQSVEGWSSLERLCLSHCSLTQLILTSPRLSCLELQDCTALTSVRSRSWNDCTLQALKAACLL